MEDDLIAAAEASDTLLLLRIPRLFSLTAT
jgi:hypothetical protein